MTLFLSFFRKFRKVIIHHYVIFYKEKHTFYEIFFPKSFYASYMLKLAETAQINQLKKVQNYAKILEC